MSNSYTTRGGLILPEVGQNLNTWGDLLNNNNFPLVDKGLFGFQAITVTGDFSLTRANGTESSTQINKAIYLTGTPTADFAVTFLEYEQSILFKNSSGRSATVAKTGGTGVTLATGQNALLAYNSTLGEVTNISPNRIPGNAVIDGSLQVGGKISNVTAGTAALDAVNLTQFNNAIAAITTTGDGSFLVQATDSTRKFLASALVATSGGGISFTVVGASGANQTYSAALDITSMTAYTAPVDADQLAAYDTTGTSHKKITLQNLLVVGWGVAAAVDAAADYTLIYDASANALKKTLVSTIADEGQLALVAGVYAL